jgi:hypothetical protein
MNARMLAVVGARPSTRFVRSVRDQVEATYQDFQRSISGGSVG